MEFAFSFIGRITLLLINRLIVVIKAQVFNFLFSKGHSRIFRNLNSGIMLVTFKLHWLSLNDYWMILIEIVHFYHIFITYITCIYMSDCLSLSDLLHWVWQSRSIHVAANAIILFFLWLSHIPCCMCYPIIF